MLTEEGWTNLELESLDLVVDVLDPESCGRVEADSVALGVPRRARAVVEGR